MIITEEFLHDLQLFGELKFTEGYFSSSFTKEELDRSVKLHDKMENHYRLLASSYNELLENLSILIAQTRRGTNEYEENYRKALEALNHSTLVK